jgi:hypothetical protein
MAGAAAALFVGMSGCGGSKGYTIPAQICGETVNPKLLAPLLSDGKEFEAEREVLDSRRQQCVVSVDGKSAVLIDEYQDQNYFDALDHAQKTRSDGNPESSARAANAAIVDGEFIAVTPCAGRGSESHHVLDVSLTGSREEAREKRDELERFAGSYLSASLKKLGCRT